MRLLILLITFITLSNCYSPPPHRPTAKPVKEVQSFKIEDVRFQSKNKVSVYAKLYHNNNDKEVILLCHQARYNKFEYEKIAPRLRDMGYNVMAIDQRSGGLMGEHPNETAQDAITKGIRKEIIPDSLILEDYVKAEVDIVSALNYLNQKYKKSVILWGSSYSSTLGLYQAIHNAKVKAVISFSPGNYMIDYKGSLKEQLSALDKPMFVTSSKDEAPELKDLISEMNLFDKQVQFIPQGNGKHGSKALWTRNPDHKEYWEAITLFLRRL